MESRRIMTPDQRLRVFVSSTLQELEEERAVVKAAIKSLRLSPVMFELGARPHPPQDLYRAYLDQSDIFVGIYWQSYGWIGPGMERSGLEEESLQSMGKPRLIYVKTPAPDREERLSKFLEDIRSAADTSYKQFSTVSELGKLVKDDLAILLSEGFVHNSQPQMETESMLPQPERDTSQPIPQPETAPSDACPQPLYTEAFTEASGPSIAVLPFSNLSSDPDHAYFVDGMVDGIITALSRFKWLIVIARNSTFAYKDRAVDIRAVGRELGVRYVLEGSVRATGQRVRVHGQLIEASTGAHVWADHFDGSMLDVFDLEDRVTESVVSALEPQIRRAEIERARRKRPEHLGAYDFYLRALPHAYAMRPEDNVKALEFLEEAMRLDPNFIPARAFAAWCYEERLSRSWPNVRSDDAQRALQLAQEVLAADTGDANLIAIAGFVLVMVGRRYDSGLEALHVAVELNPNNAFVLMNAGWAEAFAGNLELALARLERARMLNSRDPTAFYVLTGLAMVNMLLGRPEQATEFATRSAAVYDMWDATYLFLALSLAASGRTEEAQAAVSRYLELWPIASVRQLRRMLPIRDPERFAALEHNMRLAGVPD
jgi:TolB-like protein/Tfp pilus assembly protein PilF